MAKITYEDKEALRESTLPAKNQVRDVDMNEIKNSVNAAYDELDLKQEVLVSGTNIKTIGNQSLLGSGDIPLNGLNYKGTWDSATNTPTLSDGGGGGVQGDYYVVAISGSTDIDGNDDWKVGDWIVNNGTVWEKIDNTDISQWIIPTVAFVSSSTGDDATAVVGDGNKPFKTISAAHLVSALVYILPGTYTESVSMQSNTRYHCYQGVLFTSGGFVDASNTVSATVSGYARFSGTSIALNISHGTTVLLEFDTIDNTSSSGIIRSMLTSGTANLTLKGNSVRGLGGGGYGLRIQGSTNLIMNISKSIRCFYNVIDFRGSYSGTAVITCPDIIMEEGGSAGNNAAFKAGVSMSSVTSTADVTINGNIRSELLALLPSQSVSGLISINGASSGKLTVNGNLIGGYLRSIYSNQAISIAVNGNISSNQKIADLVTAAVVTINNSTILKEQTTGEVNAFTVGAFTTLNLKNCNITTESTNGNIIQHESSGKIDLDSVEGTTNGTGEFIRTNGNASTGTITNTRANAGIDSAFIYVGGFSFVQVSSNDIGFLTTFDRFTASLKTTKVNGVDVLQTTSAGLGIGVAPENTGENTLTVLNGTPHAGVENSSQVYSADQVAGNACFHTRSELGQVVKLFTGEEIPNPSGGLGVDSQARSAINSILDRMRALGLIES